MKNINVLYLDEDLKGLERFRADFGGYYNVFTALTSATAQIILCSHEIQVLIVVQPSLDSVQTKFLNDARQLNANQYRIVLSDDPKNKVIEDAIHEGLIFRSILKPYDLRILKNVIDASYQLTSWLKCKKI